MASARHAEIAGAGVAGLAAAAALAQSGWSVRVHERFPQVREVGAGIAVGRNGVEALTALGALDETIADGAEMRSWTIGDGRGRTVQSADLPPNTLYACKRESLQRALLNVAQRAGAEIVTNSVATSARQGELGIGEKTLPADLVVVADGGSSRVRATIPGIADRARRVDLKAASLRYIIDSVDGDPTDCMPEWISENRRVGLLPLANNKMAVYMFCPPGDARGRHLPMDKRSWARSFPHLASMFARLPSQGTWLPVVESRNPSWVSGNVLLLGDAAFGMAPNLGQGACTAIQASVSLAARLAVGDDVQVALRDWETAERPQVDFVQMWSRRYSRIVSQWPVFAGGMRGPLLRSLDRSPKLNARFAGVVQ